MRREKYVPVVDPLAQQLSLKEEIREAITRVLGKGEYILGPEVEAFEAEFSEYLGIEDAVGVANGTDAIALALRGLGLGPGDEVITASHTAVATVAAIELAGCIPVLVDVEPGFLTLNPEQLEEVFTKYSRAVVAVHLYGQPADLDRIQQFCGRHGLALIEDVSQAHGARWRGKRAGTFGQVSTFSCYPTKNLGAIGDAGIIATNDSTVADRVRRLRQYGWDTSRESLEPGFNSRLDEMQAAVLRVKLQHLDAHNAIRRKIANQYYAALVGTSIQAPQVRPMAEHVYHLFVVESPDREFHRQGLIERGIGTAVRYPLAVHQQSAYRGRLRTASSMAATEAAVERVLCLPMFPELSQADAYFVASSLKDLDE